MAAEQTSHVFYCWICDSLSVKHKYNIYKLTICWTFIAYFISKGCFAHKLRSNCWIYTVGKHVVFYHHQGVRYASSSCVSSKPDGVPSRSCHQLSSGKKEILTEVGAKQWRQSTLNSGKTRTCFPAESAHYKRQYKSFPQVSTTPWPQMGVNGEDESLGQATKADCKPLQQAPPSQLGTQMYTYSMFPPPPFLSPAIVHRLLIHWATTAALLLLGVFCCGTSVKRTE